MLETFRDVRPRVASLCLRIRWRYILSRLSRSSRVPNAWYARPMGNALELDPDIRHRYLGLRGRAFLCDFRLPREPRGR